MTLEQLKNFIALGAHRNFTKAAERNYISQPSFSRSVAALEQSLGIKLLNRDTRSVALTPAGEHLYREGSRILDELYMLEGDLKDMAAGLTGHLTVLTPDFFCAPFSELCRRFQEEYPDVRLELEAEKSWQIAERIEKYEADVGLAFLYEVHGAELAAYEMYSDEIAVMLPQGHPLAAREQVSLCDLDGEKILFFGDSSVKNSGNSGIFQAFETRKDFHIVHSLDTALQRMYAGQGVVVLPRSVGMDKAAAGNFPLLRLEDVKEPCQIGLVCRRDNENPILEKFLQCFSEK